MALVAASLAPNVGAQEKDKKQRGPRALAVVETGGTEAQPGGTKAGRLTTGIGFPRLVPVTILENGEYHDATVYKATPVPLAVQSGIVYEVLHAGAPEGLFVIQEPNQLHGSWIGTGKLQPPSTEPKSKPEAAAPATANSDDEGPPRLRRSVEPPPQVKAPPAPPAQAKPPKPAPVEAKRMLPHLLVAISDAGTYENRPYPYPWTPRWKAQYTKEMVALAQRALAAYNGCKPGKTPATSCSLNLEAVEVQAFDLETNNDAELVLNARAKRNGQNLYVTVVGRVGSLAQVDKVFTGVTDDAHLDTTGRLEFIDAVDADGDGRGELLFRRLHNATQTFELYRVGREQMWKLFDGAESSL